MPPAMRGYLTLGEVGRVVAEALRNERYALWIQIELMRRVAGFEISDDGEPLGEAVLVADLQRVFAEGEPPRESKP